MKILILSAILTVTLGLRAQDEETLSIGEPAPDFELEGIDGTTYTLNSFSDAKVLTIVFSANHCPTA